ncbi:MAG: hypothetical protein OXE94_02005 [Aestuariivita sp.]|nr:hypothetical protein [Aestuariivita sp.]MCY4203843.1 hypothetical protein [Aestuariivita sp.]
MDPSLDAERDCFSGQERSSICANLQHNSKTGQCDATMLSQEQETPRYSCRILSASCGLVLPVRAHTRALVVRRPLLQPHEVFLLVGMVAKN